MIISLLSIIISGCSFVLSALALYLTHRQKVHQDKFETRKALSDTISAISSINNETAKLSEEMQNIGRRTNLTRNLNSQRRFLAYHAELLTREIPKFTADIDHLLIAGAFASSDSDRAEAHYKRALAISSNKRTLAVNTRTFAQFMFDQGKFEVARELFEDALRANSDNNDKDYRSRADILAVWATTELRFGYSEEATKRFDQAFEEVRRIGNEKIRERAITHIKAQREATKGITKAVEPQPETTE